MGRKRFCIFFVAALVIMGLKWPSVYAGTYTVAGKELNLLGYITQGAAIKLGGEDYNVEKDLNSLLMNLFLEADYRFADTAKFYVSGLFTADWIYDVKTSDASWNHKLFDKSRHHLYMDNNYWQLLKEAHLTWNPGNFLFRFGKQIVVWGEMDGFRLMDQINPLDQRRGFADVEFETSVIPIWLARGEYRPQVHTSWLTDLNLQFVFNPNVTWIPNQNPTVGNDAGGIWAPQAYIYNPALPFGSAHIGSQTLIIDNKPKSLDSDGFAYAFRINGTVLGAAVSLNYYYGREKDPATVGIGLNPDGIADDGRLIFNPVQKGFFPLFRFVGATFSRDIPPLRASALGGVAPVVRIESIYAFSNTFGVMNPVTFAPRFVKSDDFRFGIGVDWKVKIPVLNPRAFFMISPQFYYRRIMDFPSGEEATGLKDTGLLKDNYTTTLMVATNYLNSKLAPSVFWLRDLRGHADFFRLQLTYNYTEQWQFTIGSVFLGGSKKGVSFDNFSEKDYLFFKVGFKWS